MSGTGSDLIFDFDIIKVMTALPGDNRTIFTSEADFQFALAWEIKQLYPEYDIRLEEILDVGDGKHHFIHVDIIIHDKDNKIIPIELKYCTKSAPVEDLDGFILKNQGAEDIRRYDFIKDIQRVESIRNKHKNDGRFVCGYCIFLTNSERYWKPKKNREECIDKDFLIDEDSIISGKPKEWNRASSGTMKGREAPLKTDEYEIVWEDYVKDKSLRYLCITIERK